jgi:hypothetical protein
MKKLLFTISMSFLSIFCLYSQEGNWEWARLFQSNGAIVTDSWGMDMCMDVNDNVYIVGVFRTPASLTIGTQTLTNRGLYDIFICSFEADGEFRWAKSIGCSQVDDIAGLVIDGGDLYLAGAFNGLTVYFTDTETLTNSVGTSPYNYDSYIAHYQTSDGSFLGAKRVFWGTNNQRLQDMTLDNFNDYLVVVGQFTNQLIYNNGVQDTTINPLGTKDFIIARFDLSGGFDNLQFHDLKRFYSDQASTSLKQVNMSVIGSNHNGYFISGDLYGTLTFLPTKSITGTSATKADALVFKVDNNLAYEWARRGGGTAYDHVNSSGSDNSGNVYLAGKFEGQNGTFDSTDTYQSRILKSKGLMDFYIAKYNREGRLLWLYQVGYAGNDDAFGMAIQGNYLQVAGNVSDEGNTNTGFIKLDLAGNYINQGEMHGDGEDVGKGVTFDSHGFTVITGYFNSGTLYFGPRTDPDTILVNTSGTYDAFLGKYQYPLTIVQEEVRDVSCNGGNDGYIRLRAEFGAGCYTWSWEHETNPTPVADSLVAGTYIVTLTDCEGDTAKATIHITEPTKISISRTITNVSCFNGSSGAINISPSGGTPGTPPTYAYFWSGGSGLNPTAEDQTGLSAGSFTVRVTDDNGCWLDSTFNVTQPTRLIIDNLRKWDVHPCSSSNGSAKVYVSGGTPNYGYLWSNNKTTDSIGSLSRGDYSVKVTDANSCSVTSQIITIIDSCEVNLIIDNVNNVSCHDGSDASIILSTFGGQRPYTYSGIAELGLNDSIAENLIAGNYKIVVTDNLGDKDTVDVSITQPSQIFVTVQLTDVICFGESTGKINITVSGGTPPYQHRWSTGATTEDLTNIPFGNYSDTITDANGCVLIKNYVILQNPEIKLSNSKIDSVSCFGLNDGAIDITVSGGITPYSYYWLEKNWDPKDGLTSQDISDLFAGEYSVEITDDSGCVKIDTLIVPQPDLIHILLDSVKNSCPGRDDGKAWIHAIGGNGGNIYTWEPSGKTGNFVEDMPPQCYDVTVVDKKQCQSVEEVCIPENDPISINLDVIKHILCTDSCDGSVFITTSGGTPPYNWLWFPDGETTEDIINKCAGNYNVTVTDAASCSAISPTYEIEDQSVPTVIIRQDKYDITCFESNNGEIVLKADGAQPMSYSIDNGTSWQSDTLFTGLSARSYITVFKDGNGCFSYGDTLLITEPLEIQITAIIANDSCYGNSNGTITTNIAGGTHPYNCLWDDGPVICDRNGLLAGSYTLTITDDHGCNKDTTFTVTEPSELKISDVDILGSTVTIFVSGGTDPYIYRMVGGVVPIDSSKAGNLFYNLGGEYKVYVEDIKGCKDSIDKTDIPKLCCVSIDELSDNSGISLYPNPTTGKLTVEIEARDNKDIYLEIVNLMGQLIWKKELQNNGQPRFVEVIDMSQQSKGTYFMRVNGLPVHTKILLE